MWRVVLQGPQHEGGHVLSPDRNRFASGCGNAAADVDDWSFQAMKNEITA